MPVERTAHVGYSFEPYARVGHAAAGPAQSQSPSEQPTVSQPAIEPQASSNGPSSRIICKWWIYGCEDNHDGSGHCQWKPDVETDPAVTHYRSLINFVTDNHVQPNPRDVIPRNASRHATGVQRVEKLDGPPTEPRLIPTSAIFPDGVPKKADMFKVLRKSAVKSLGSPGMYNPQVNQLRSQAPYEYTQAEALSCHNITGNPEFMAKLKMFHPLGQWPEGERATTTNNTFSILPAKVMQDLTVDIATNIVCTISGRRVWLLRPPGGPQFYKDWATALSTGTPGAVMWLAFGTQSPLIAVTEAGGDALYIPPGWRYCSYSLEGGYDANIRVVYESSQLQAASIWVRMFHGMSPGGDQTISDGIAKTLIRPFRAVLRSMTSGIRQEDTFRTVDMLRDVLGCEASEMKALGWGNRKDDERRWGVLMAYWGEEVGEERNREYLVNKMEME